MIGIDTLSWGKLLLLSEQFDQTVIVMLLDHFHLFITEEVKTELIHFYKEENDWLWSNAVIMPKMERNYDRYVKQGFDEADATLLEYSEMPNYSIVTEDYPMLLLNVTGKNNIIQLVDFLSLCYTLDYIDTATYKQFVNWLRTNRNITKKKLKRITGRYYP